MSETGTECLWCGTKFSAAERAKGKLYCDASCKFRYKRAQRAAAQGDLLEALGPFVMDDGIEIYRQLVNQLAGTIRKGTTT